MDNGSLHCTTPLKQTYTTDLIMQMHWSDAVIQQLRNKTESHEEVQNKIIKSIHIQWSRIYKIQFQSKYFMKLKILWI